MPPPSSSPSSSSSSASAPAVGTSRTQAAIPRTTPPAAPPSAAPPPPPCAGRSPSLASAAPDGFCPRGTTNGGSGSETASSAGITLGHSTPARHNMRWRSQQKYSSGHGQP
eukprot:scaffold9247_cov133-Isochrysis_galbana.AAC.6